MLLRNYVYALSVLRHNSPLFFGKNFTMAVEVIRVALEMGFLI